MLSTTTTHHHSPPAKINPSKKVFYKKNMNIFLFKNKGKNDEKHFH